MSVVYSWGPDRHVKNRKQGHQRARVTKLETELLEIALGSFATVRFTPAGQNGLRGKYVNKFRERTDIWLERVTPNSNTLGETQ